MADQLVAATVGVLLEKAVSLAADRINLVLGFRKDLEALQEHAKDIHAVLSDAEAKQSSNQFVLRWLRKVEAAAFEAEYVLDELLYESLRRKVESRDKAKRAAKVCLFFSLSKHDLSFRWRMGSKVREINEMFKNFILEVPGIGLIRMEDSMLQADTVATNVVKGRQTNSLPLQFVAGRAKEVSEIVDTLLSGSSKATASISVLSIVGMGGLGKTTLAKSVYNNPGIDSHFAKKIWVCVSDKFEATELFRLILESLKKGEAEKSGQDAIVQEIHDELSRKRFLLVLDDVWNENQTSWDDFFNSLVGLTTASGSICLVTTRSHKVAKLVSTFPPFALDKLADNDCWYIICRKANKNGEMPQELDVSYEQVLQSSQEIDGEMLERIKVHRELILKRCQELDVHREHILKRCQGLPLAANVVGGLLSLQKREYWLRTVENKILAGELVEGEIEAILKLSFDYLPSSSIKKCFAYCSVYAKDTKIDGRELVEIWMAKGFLQEGVESMATMEEVGDEYLTILLQSSLLEKANNELRGREATYQMHDLVHDLAESISKRERIDREVHHLAFNGNWNNAKLSSVRIVEGVISDMMLLKFKRLRVLNLDGMKVENFPNAIGKVKHLRCLHAMYSDIKSLPGTVCKLYNLQTLDLSNCWSLQCLPHELSNLISLRHLHFDGRDGMKMPPNMGRLTCLQTLKFFNVGEEKGHEIEELGSMKNLAGKIRLCNLELVKGKEGARLANLFEKKRLKGLDLNWRSTEEGGNDNCNDEQVLEGLEPHPNLQVLTLRSYMGARLPRWFGQLTALTQLTLSYCTSLKDVPTLGHLPCLEYLQFAGLHNLTCIGESFYREGLWERKVFPSLKTMNLGNLPNLSEWKGSAVNNGLVFPKLETLVISNCCQLASVPSPFPSLKELLIEGNIPVSVVKDTIGKRASFLKTLEISSMGGLNSLADVIDNHLTRLEYFSIESCDNLIEIPNSALELCASLNWLYVCGCPKLMPWALNLQRTPSLSSLVLDCPNMFSTNVMPTGFKYLTNLWQLRIGPFTDDSIQSFDWSGLKACSSTLNVLHWSGSLQEHSGLSQQLQHLTSLEYLSLLSLNSVEALPDWLGNLTSLRELEVRDCPILRCLPSAHAMGRLTNLRTLNFRNCPVLAESSIHDISSTLPNLQISRV